jgi:hypothetical protein
MSWQVERTCRQHYHCRFMFRLICVVLHACNHVIPYLYVVHKQRLSCMFINNWFTFILYIIEVSFCYNWHWMDAISLGCMHTTFFLLLFLAFSRILGVQSAAYKRRFGVDSCRPLSPQQSHKQQREHNCLNFQPPPRLLVKFSMPKSISTNTIKYYQLNKIRGVF